MTFTEFQGHRCMSSRKELKKKILPYMCKVAILSCDLDDLENVWYGKPSAQ